MILGLFMPVLYHNPRCSKSRQALLLCDDSSLDIDVHLYLNEPLDYDTLHSMLERLQGDVSQAVRWKDKAIKSVDTSGVDSNNIESIALFLSKHGQFMERPWLDVGNSTVIGRPVENLICVL
jgi:arsenate reductase